MPWVETESLSFTARHDSGDSAYAERTLDRMEDLRLRLEDRFKEVPGDVTVVIHTNPALLAMAHPFLPAARWSAAPSGRRYLAGWAMATELHVLNDPHMERRAAGEDSREALRGTAERLYAQLVVAANNPDLPPSWTPRRRHPRRHDLRPARDRARARGLRAARARAAPRRRRPDPGSSLRRPHRRGRGGLARLPAGDGPSEPGLARLPGFTALGALEADPERVHRRRDDPLPGHLGVLRPPHGQPLEDAAQHDPDHFDALAGARAGDVRGARLRREQRQERLAAARRDLGVDRLDLGVGAVAEEHAAGERVLLDVGEPSVEGRRYAPLERPLADEVLAPHLAQLGEVALEQLTVEVALGVEVFVDDRRRDAGAPGDLLDRGAAVAALGEQLRGGGGDQLAPRRRREASARRVCGLGLGRV